MNSENGRKLKNSEILHLCSARGKQWPNKCRDTSSRYLFDNYKKNIQRKRSHKNTLQHHICALLKMICCILHSLACPEKIWRKGSFSSVTSTNARASPQNFLTFSFNVFVTWTWTKNTHQKKCFFGQILIKLRLW